MSLSNPLLRLSIFLSLSLLPNACVSQGIPTITTLALCVGGSSPNCPIDGVPSNLTSVPSVTMVYGQIFNGTESVQDSNGTAYAGTGTLGLYQDGILLCALPATAVGPTCPAAVGTGTSAGTHIFTSVYSGDATHAGSTSSPITLNVLHDTPTANLTPSANPSLQGQSTIFTAILTGNHPPPSGAGAPPIGNYAPPTGQIILVFGGNILGTSLLRPISPGIASTATFTTPSLPAGNDSITVSYPGDRNFAATTSSPLVETISPAIPPPGSKNFTLTAAPSPVVVGAGSAAPLTVTVTPLAGFTQPVTLSCGNLPFESKCIFTNPTIPAGGGSTTLVLSTTPPRACQTQSSFMEHPNLAPFALPMLAGLIAFFPGRRRWLRALIALATIVGVMQITGCGTCTDLGTRPDTYTIRIAGTASGTAEVESVPVTMNVAI